MSRKNRRLALVSGFTLVEVLLAIVVLSLGLLGLGAVIPVVIRQQRLAGDLISGVSAAASAEAAIRGRLDLRTGQVATSGPAIEPWRAWRDEDRPGGLFENTEGNSNESTRRAGVWRVPAYDVSNGTLAIQADNPTVEFDAATGDAEDRFTFPVAQRLLPSPTPGGPAPRYVWDFVARRAVERDAQGRPRFADADGVNAGADSVQVAVFVRAIDPAVRVPAGVTLAESFTGIGQGRTSSIAVEERRVPVSVSLGSSGGPQFNGRVGGGPTGGAYATPIVLALDDAIEYDDPDNPDADLRNDRNRLVFAASSSVIEQLPIRVPEYESLATLGNVTTSDVRMSRPQAVALAGQINQQLVDAFGNIYRVVGRDGDQLIIDPPVPTWVEFPEDLIAMAFVPQPPAEVRVFTLELD